jgi:hypothetical protein
MIARASFERSGSTLDLQRDNYNAEALNTKLTIILYRVTKEVDAKNVPIVKGSKGLESVLSKIKGQKKMTSTQKSALDWNQFKEKEGIEQELQHAAKDGYLEKVAFMERTDLRQFEKEKELRDEMRKVNAKKQSK